MVTVGGNVSRSHAAAAIWRVPRTRGATSGVLLVLLGLWGGLVPFIGPRFGFAYTPNVTWTMTWGRAWLEVLPAAAALLGGLTLAFSANRVAGMWGGWLAALGGAWFVVGPSVSRLFFHGQSQTGAPLAGSTLRTVAEEVAHFYGLGALIVFLAGMAIGRFSVVGVREVEAIQARAAAAEAEAEERELANERAAAADRNADEAPTAVTQRIPSEQPTRHRRGPDNGDRTIGQGT